MKKIRIGIDITDLSSNFYGGLDTYCVNLIKGFSKIDTNHKIVIFLNRKYYEKRKKNLSFKNNISYQLYDISILYKVLIKIYNRVFVPISFLFFKFKYFLDFIVRNLSQNSFKNLVEQNCDILICPAVLLKHYNLKVPTLTNLHDFNMNILGIFF